MQPILCPYCGFEYTHHLENIEPGLFEGRFKQKCIAAFYAYCENGGTHVFVVLIGQHKGQILLETVKAGE